jgi:hypothetical protein
LTLTDNIAAVSSLLAPPFIVASAALMRSVGLTSAILASSCITLSALIPVLLDRSAKALSIYVRTLSFAKFWLPISLAVSLEYPALIAACVAF